MLPQEMSLPLKNLTKRPTVLQITQNERKVGVVAVVGVAVQHRVIQVTVLKQTLTQTL